MTNLEPFLQELLVGGAYIEDGRLRVPASGDLPPEKLALLSERMREILRLLPTYSFEMPLSYGQEALWFVHKNAANKAVYNTALVLHLQSAVDKALLRDIFQKIGQRHTVLRTTIAVSNGQPKQIIHATQALSFEEVDCSGQSWEIVMQAVEQANQRLFDLSEGPLWRVTLITQSPDSQVLLIAFHHTIIDGWSLWMLVDEFLALYAAGDANAVNLPPITNTYAKFVQWQREMLETDGQRLRAYWQEALGGDLPVLDLPTDHPRPKMATYQTGELPFRLSSSLRDELRALARREGVSFYTVLLAAFQLLLARLSNAERILVGVPTAGREREAFGQTFGYFVNPVVVDATLTDVPFTTFLQQVGAKLLAAIEHRAYPFPSVVKDLGIERDPSRGPIFQAILVVQRPQKLSEETLRLLKGEQVQLGCASGVPDLLLELGGWKQTTGESDIIFDLIEHTTSHGLVGHIRYRTDIFEEPTIERMGQHYQQLLEAIVSDATEGIDQLPLLTEQERHQLLIEWNDTATDYPKDKCIHQLFEQQVARTPEAIAVVFGDQELTYRELNGRANQLAHYLQAQRVGPDVLVGICVERSVEMVVGLLGILKAGGAYVPLDPEYPPERLAFMLEDAQVSILLASQQVVERVSEQAVQLLLLDTDWPATACPLGIAAESAEYPSNQARESGRRIGPDSLAYVIYTSGSTGRPKGVMVPHRAINRLVNNTNYIEITAQDRMAQASNASFDAVTFEIWGALLHGACLVGIPHEVAISPPRLALFLQRQEISILFLTTALFNQVVNLAPEAFANLRYLLFGGEAVDPVSVRKLLSYGPPEHFLHVYGPTENTTYSSWYPIQSVAENARTVPIGIPIANTQIYILDGQLEPVPVGVPGELYLGGDGLALGYLNRPKLTFDAFIPNPFRKDTESGRVGEWESGRGRQGDKETRRQGDKETRRAGEWESGRVGGSTRRGICAATYPTETSSFWDAQIIRLRFAASASSWVRLRAP